MQGTGSSRDGAPAGANFCGDSLSCKITTGDSYVIYRHGTTVLSWKSFLFLWAIEVIT